MAATATPINSSALVIQISSDGGTTYDILGYINSATLTRTMETRDITSKLSCGWRTLGEGMRSWNLSGEGFITYVATTGEIDPYSIHQLWETRGQLDVKFTSWDCEAGNVIAGDPYYEGKCYITSLEESGGVEDNGTYSVTFEGTGILSHDVNP